MKRNRKIILLTVIVGVVVFLLPSFSLTSQSTAKVMSGRYQVETESFKNYQPESAPEQRKIMELRKQHVNDVCKRVKKISGRMIDVSGLKGNNFSFCMVQKAGCTVYKRLFKYFNRQDDWKSYGKYETYFDQIKDYKRIGKNDIKFVMNSLRAMTVRNPFTRLWSAFIDKFILPDFWFLRGRAIIKQFRKDPSAESLNCGHDVTFQEFMEYVITTGHSMNKNVAQDRHWMPASDICDPCFFKPEIINQQETFLADLRYTLHEANLTRFLEKLIAKDPTSYEIMDEINYNFKMYPRFKNCTDKFGIANRIWSAFNLNGYIPADEPFPEDLTNGTLNPDIVYEKIKKIRETRTVTKEDTKLARKLALHAAYSQIPQEYIEQLQELYKYDFELFGYPNKPVFL